MRAGQREQKQNANLSREMREPYYSILQTGQADSRIAGW